MGMMKWTPTIPLAPYKPDLTSLGSGGTDVAWNAVPKVDGWGPFKSEQEWTKALPAGCRGYFFARLSTGAVNVFAGTIDKLYLLDNTTFTWTDVSKGGVAYGSLVTTDNWQFAQFADLVIAVQVNTPPQKYDLAAGGTFVNLGGSPPQAGAVAVVNLILVLGRLLSNPRRIQWSDLGAPETWTAGVGTADFEDFPDGGVVLGIAGGDSFGRVFQDDTVRSLIYAPGSATTFQIRKVQVQETLFAAYSIIASGSRTFYCSASGFKMMDGAEAQPQPIGKGQVDTTFFADVDRGNLQLVLGATDPTNTRVYWAYKSTQGQAGLIDKILMYDWALDRWGVLIDMEVEYLAALAKPGLTLEALDAIAPTPLDITGAANNGSGAIRLTLTTLDNGDFAIEPGNTVNLRVYDVEGTVEANAYWNVTIIDATHIDLIGSTFVNAYTGSGHIGGALENLPFSLDSIGQAAVAAVSIFTSDHKCGFFDGPNMEATIETSEQDLGGPSIFVSGVRPLTDAPGVMCSIGTKLSAQASVTYMPESAVNEYGFAGALVETRYALARLRIPAAQTWTYASGAQALAGIAGDI